MGEARTVIPPLEHRIDRKNLRAVFTVIPSLGTDVEFDTASLEAAFDEWLRGDKPLILYGVTMVLYEIKEETWRDQPPML